jgi:S1-C subfamily serine protease
MTTLDWLIVAFALTLATLGFGRGFVVGALSFVGFAAGALIGTRVGPLLLPQGSSSPYAPLFGLFGALVAGVIIASGIEGVAFRLRSAMVIPGMRLIDGLLGAVLGAALGLGIVWILAAVLAQAPNEAHLRADIQRSAILRGLNSLLPPTGPILNALARLDPQPSINGPPPGVEPPAPRSALEPGVRIASPSAVRVLGTACGLAIEGSGWVARGGLVVTNAHVVAGEHDTTVELGGRSPGVAAQAVAFDATDDVAVLRASGLDAPGLSLAASPHSGTPAAILGFPENGPLTAEGARIGRTQTVLTDDAYGRGPVMRLLTPLRGRVRSGNSGGPVVDRSGRVLTTVFAGTLSGPRGGYGVANSTVAAVLEHARRRAGAGLTASTEGCAAG